MLLTLCYRLIPIVSHSSVVPSMSPYLMHPFQVCVQPRKNGCNMFIKQKRWCVEHCSDDASVATTAAEKIILCVLLEEFSEPDEIGINTCLILQNTLHVTVTASRIKRTSQSSEEGICGNCGY